VEFVVFESNKKVFLKTDFSLKSYKWKKLGHHLLNITFDYKRLFQTSNEHWLESELETNLTKLFDYYSDLNSTVCLMFVLTAKPIYRITKNGITSKLNGFAYNSSICNSKFNRGFISTYECENFGVIYPNGSICFNALYIFSHELGHCFGAHALDEKCNRGFLMEKLSCNVSDQNRLVSCTCNIRKRFLNLFDFILGLLFQFYQSDWIFHFQKSTKMSPRL